MILYKYLSAEIGLKVLTGNKIGFTQPSLLNDPFDTPLYPKPDGLGVAESMLESVHRYMKASVWEANTGILSLSRSPLNPLMWAHYGRNHTGMVIGFDVKVAGFSDLNRNLIPAQYGNVVYCSTRPTHELLEFFGEPMHVGETYRFMMNHYEKLQRLFLHKSEAWSYEEEIRVVKCVKGAENGSIESGYFTIVGEDTGQRYLYDLPQNSLAEVYLGLNNGLESVMVHDALKSHPQVSVKKCQMSDTTWELNGQKWLHDKV